MKLTQFIYHENNLEKPYIPQEDYYSHKDNIFVVSDGITHDLVDGFYPNPSDSGVVAKIICEEILNNLIKTGDTVDDIKNAIQKASKKVKNFNNSSELFINRENNGFTIGAAVFAVIIIRKGKLLYAVLDDCYVSIFSDDMVGHPTLLSFVDKSAKHFDANYDWSNPEHRKVWRKNYRNNELEFNGEKYGYGAIDGRSGFDPYIQYGEEKLKNGDLVCLYTDGFIKIIGDIGLIKGIKNSNFSMETLDMISKYTKNKCLTKEKTCYFIKYSE